MAPPSRRRVLCFGGGSLIIEPETRQVFVRGEALDLTLSEYRLLEFLAERAGRVLSVEALAEGLWPDNPETNIDNVRWHIWRLRRKIEADPEDPEFILTERGLGYRFTFS
jgi:DNA-binding response OmpR family regulator